ncbi:MAG TPA: proline--tRNA ligase, partial [Candidatus Megaira endosymbiont of Hartmannula sinica]|nr:proline--tRNA ligase [Candidatus Megaera endosymbiont of Hartmannula sinica]
MVEVVWRLWEQSGRINTYGQEMLKFKDRHNNELLFGPTNEEAITDVIKHTIKSYKELPKILYQIQWKFRDEIRPRFGVMRGREFLMKDAYSININKEDAAKTYNEIFACYLKIFNDMDLCAIPLKASTGEIGGDMSHEFHIAADNGESILYYDKKFDFLKEDLVNNIEKIKSLYTAADEEHDYDKCPIDESQLIVKRGIEIGHIFNFGHKYSEQMQAKITLQNGKSSYVHMGSYGIGMSRLVAAIIETHHDENGIIWPENVAPFRASLININPKDLESKAFADSIYCKLRDHNIEVLYDDTSGTSPGYKFSFHDLIGMPWQIIVGGRNRPKDMIELKHRKTREIIECSLDNIDKYFNKIL